MRGGPVHAGAQQEAALCAGPAPGQRSPGLSAGAQRLQRRVRLGPLRRAAGPASRTTEPPGELRQYLHHLPRFVLQ